MWKWKNFRRVMKICTVFVFVRNAPICVVLHSWKITQLAAWTLRKMHLRHGKMQYIAFQRLRTQWHNPTNIFDGFWNGHIMDGVWKGYCWKPLWRHMKHKNLHDKSPNFIDTLVFGSLIVALSPFLVNIKPPSNIDSSRDSSSHPKYWSG
jgi:hypothetical protein